MTQRDQRQQRVSAWVIATFGVAVSTPQERIDRLIEEAIELAQALQMPAERIKTLVDHVYSKPAGMVAQEVGGVGTTLLALCQSIGVSAEDEERAEFERVLAIDPAYFRARQNVKADAGVAIRCEPDKPA